MKKLLFTIGTLFWAVPTFGQGPDCVSALPTCGNLQLKYNPQGKGINDFANPLNNGECFKNSAGGPEHQSAWYKIKIAKSGLLTFLLVPDNLKNDYDFGIWKADKGCDALGSPVRCNTAAEEGATGLDINATFISQGPGEGSNKCAALEVHAGEFYYILIDNASRASIGAFQLNFGGTATLGEVINVEFNTKELTCGVVALKSTTTSCNSDALNHYWEIISAQGQVLHTFTEAAAVTPKLAVGKYQVKLTVSTPSGTTETKSSSIEIKDIGALKVKYNLICNRLVTEAQIASCQNATFTYEWVVKNQQGKIISQKQSTIPQQEILLANGQQTVSIIAKGSTGLVLQKDSVFNLDIPTVQISQSERACFDDGKTVTLTATTNAKDKQQAAVTWLYNGNVVGKTASIEVQKAGNYEVMIQYEQCQLKGTTSVDNYCTGIIYAPTAFSPNADGLNDVWKVWGKRFKDLEIYVLDQWGREVFATQIPNEQGFGAWDGTVKGLELPTGLYVVSMKYLDLGTLLVTTQQQNVVIIR